MFLAYALVPAWPEKSSVSATGVIVALCALPITLILVVFSNLRIIQADMSFKTAEIFAQPSTWPVAIRIYERANDLAPNEDYYYLFLGRAYLEYARSLQNPSDRDQLMQQAASDLRKAQSINPLNPDHTANLARLNSLWAASTTDEEKRQRLAKISDEYFSRAVTLKPKDAKLWDEWALLYLNVLGQPDEALRRLKSALEIDPFYDWTYGLLGDYTQRYLAETAKPHSDNWNSEMKQAADYFTSAIKYSDANNNTFKYNYAISLAALQLQLGQIEDAIQTYELALNTLPENSDNWKIHETLARLYSQIGDETHAISNALTALENAPEDQKSRLQEFVSSLGG
jgi:tetratricopeptide (TPR) repeat protein